MTASSVTGKGLGNSKKFTTNQLCGIANGPSIFAAGTVESVGLNTSPPSSGNTVTLSTPLEGGSDNYVVILTSLSGGYSYVTDMNENGSGEFIGFDFATETDCTLMYIVVKKGSRPL